MKNISWKKFEDEALLELVKIYGVHRPSDICFQLKQIYGITKMRPQVMSRCKVLNSHHKIHELSQEEFMKIWNHFQKYEDKLNMYPLEVT